MCRAISYLTVLTSVLLAASFARGQAGAPSDILDEVITDHHGNTINHPISITIPEPGPGATEGGIIVTVPALTIDFHDPNNPTGQNISDRLHIDSYQVTIRSDDETGLAPRTGSTFIPVEANERFLPFSILVHSDGDSTAGNTTESDHLHIVQGFYSGQPAALIKVFADVSFAEPVPEGPDSPPRFDFVIPPTSYDIAEGTAGTASIISDYLDHGPISGYFISSDNQADYDTALPVDGIVLEDGLFATDPNGPNPFYGGDLNFALRFTSDTEVPEPGTLVLAAVGLASVVVIGRTKFARTSRPAVA